MDIHTLFEQRAKAANLGADGADATVEGGAPADASPLGNGVNAGIAYNALRTLMNTETSTSRT